MVCAELVHLASKFSPGRAEENFEIVLRGRAVRMQMVPRTREGSFLPPSLRGLWMGPRSLVEENFRTGSLPCLKTDKRKVQRIEVSSRLAPRKTSIELRGEIPLKDLAGQNFVIVAGVEVVAKTSKQLLGECGGPIPGPLPPKTGGF